MTGKDFSKRANVGRRVETNLMFGLTQRERGHVRNRGEGKAVGGS